MSTSAPVKKAQNLWIVDPRLDLLWFIGTPVLLVPAFLLLTQVMSLERLAILVVTFGAVGHHLPGMFRAYGDAELFRRYRVRFILAPIFLLTISLLFSFYRPDTLTVVVIAWGYWHSQAQIYGFLRIYDSKAGFTDARSALIDRFLCLTWFAGGIVLSTGRMTDFFSVYYRTGGSAIDAAWVRAAQNCVLGLMMVSLLAYVGHLLFAVLSGRRPSLVKLLTIVVSVSFWWYCMVEVSNIVLGVAMYEVFHDVQYLAIVWYFNRRRASTENSGWLTKALFQPQMRCVFIYVALVLTYGAGSLLTRSMDRSTVQTILTALFVASGLLHFYYDGFIWRLRERATSSMLGVAENASAVRRTLSRAPSWFPHAALWGAFVVPLAVLGFSESASDVNAQVVATLPESSLAHYNLAKERQAAENLAEGERHAQKAVGIQPSFAKAWTLLGEIHLAQGRIPSAVEHLQRAVSLDAHSATAHFNLGNAMIRNRRIDAATDAYLRAIELDPELESSSYNNLGTALQESDAVKEAAFAFERAVEADPTNVSALTNLANAEAKLGKTESAIQRFQKALTLQPEDVPAWTGLVKMMLTNNRTDDAANYAHAFAEACPDVPESWTMLGMLHLEQKNFAAAETEFSRAITIQPQHFAAQYGLATVYFRDQRTAQCRAIIDTLTSSTSLTTVQQMSVQQLKANLDAPAKTQLE
ncbi:tetratricopeptide repeat protein [Fuerstiella marisgermanici]|uniref:TPR repeat-containing protein YrrB n=1 Tax=Fuerstiella marisgermanici TaxID=1891926 RepID=A0A1P8WK03_9PLAN|nr:tetratricopeptide repeat protein [Fuerstiella marisgermanici]APZ94382.1 TPR repeat-containing protein YrrB [Fuerstiella marisgermanici]